VRFAAYPKSGTVGWHGRFSVGLFLPDVASIASFAISVDDARMIRAVARNPRYPRPGTDSAPAPILPCRISGKLYERLILWQEMNHRMPRSRPSLIQRTADKISTRVKEQAGAFCRIS